MLTYNYRGFVINVEDPRLLNDGLKSKLHTYNWESHEVAALVHLPADATVLELGGCLGIVSLFIGKKLQDPSRHVVLEPNPRLIPHMERIKNDNGASYTILNNYLGAVSGEIKPFSLHPDHIMGGRLGALPHREVVEVSGRTYRDLEAEKGFKFDSVIMDIEGGEYDLYRQEFFSPEMVNKMRFLMIELHPHSQKSELRSHLKTVFEKEIVITHNPGNSVLVYKNE